MCENYITNKKTPLRNSKSANRPFRSPLTTVITPKNNESPKNDFSNQSPLQKSATPKRSNIYQCRQPVKRRRIENLATDDLGKQKNDDEVSTNALILASKERISTKRKELDNLKRSLHYIGQHQTEDLLDEISKWRTACKEALIEFHKIIKDKTLENITMKQVLTMLGIPEETVKFTDDEYDTP